MVLGVLAARTAMSHPDRGGSNSASAKNCLRVAFSRSRSLSHLTSSRRTQWQPARAAYRKYLWRKPAPTIVDATRFSYAAAETATERPAHGAFQWPVESKHYRR